MPLVLRFISNGCWLLWRYLGPLIGRFLQWFQMMLLACTLSRLCMLLLLSGRLLRDLLLMLLACALSSLHMQLLLSVPSMTFLLLRTAAAASDHWCYSAFGAEEPACSGLQHLPQAAAAAGVACLEMRLTCLHHPRLRNRWLLPCCRYSMRPCLLCMLSTCKILDACDIKPRRPGSTAFHIDNVLMDRYMGISFCGARLSAEVACALGRFRCRMSSILKTLCLAW